MFLQKNKTMKFIKTTNGYYDEDGNYEEVELDDAAICHLHGRM